MRMPVLASYPHPLTMPGGDCTHFRRQHIRAFGSGIATRPDYGRVFKTSGFKLFEEGISFLCPRNSGEPISIALLNIGRKSVCED